MHRSKNFTIIEIIIIIISCDKFGEFFKSVCLNCIRIELIVIGLDSECWLDSEGRECILIDCLYRWKIFSFSFKSTI